MSDLPKGVFLNKGQITEIELGATRSTNKEGKDVIQYNLALRIGNSRYTSNYTFRTFNGYDGVFWKLADFFDIFDVDIFMDANGVTEDAKQAVLNGPEICSLRYVYKAGDNGKPKYLNYDRFALTDDLLLGMFQTDVDGGWVPYRPEFAEDYEEKDYSGMDIPFEAAPEEEAAPVDPDDVPF